jgi:GNAT superfamily N-acetyltransferase
MITVTAPVDDAGVAVLASTAAAAATQLGGGAEVAALSVRLLATDARRRSLLVGDTAEVTLTVEVDGTELVLAVRDTGEPVTGPPVDLLTLVDGGFATGADGGTDGSGNVTVVRVALPAHVRLLDHSDLEVVADDAPAVDAPVTIRHLEPEDAPALTRCIYRCYGWTYPNADMYFPDRVAASIESGRRIGEVAMAADGEMAAHWGAVVVADGVVETGGTVTDPRFRGRGLAAQLGDLLLDRLQDMGVHGRLREPVLTHPATQRIALREGAALVGLTLHGSKPLEQIGITDGLLADRVSLTLMYSPLVPLEPATMWIPGIYAPIARDVLDHAEWPRQLGQARAGVDHPGVSELGSSYDSLNRSGRIQVNVVGTDIVDVVDDALGALRRAGAEQVVVYLPANQPALASLGAGLESLSLGFAALIPAYGELGDALVLQWLADPDVDDSSWVFGDPWVETLANRIIGQARDLGDQVVRLRRRQAQRQQLLAALPTDDN